MFGAEDFALDIGLGTQRAVIILYDGGHHWGGSCLTTPRVDSRAVGTRVAARFTAPDQRFGPSAKLALLVPVC